jgi:hypothetical protein
MFRQKLIKSAMLLAVPLAAAQARSGVYTIADDAKHTIQQIQESAYNVENEADTLHGFAVNSGIGNEARADLLNAMRARINQIGQEMARLDAERAALTSWELRALDQAEPLMKDAATKTETLMVYFNTHKDPIWTNEYREDAANIRTDTEKVVTDIGNIIKIEKLEKREAHTKSKLKALGAE